MKDLNEHLVQTAKPYHYNLDSSASLQRGVYACNETDKDEVNTLSNLGRQWRSARIPRCLTPQGIHFGNLVRSESLWNSAVTLVHFFLQLVRLIHRRGQLFFSCYFVL